MKARFHSMKKSRSSGRPLSRGGGSLKKSDKVKKYFEVQGKGKTHSHAQSEPNLNPNENEKENKEENEEKTDGTDSIAKFKEEDFGEINSEIKPKISSPVLNRISGRDEG